MALALIVSKYDFSVWRLVVKTVSPASPQLIKNMEIRRSFHHTSVFHRLKFTVLLFRV